MAYIRRPSLLPLFFLFHFFLHTPPSHHIDGYVLDVSQSYNAQGFFPSGVHADFRVVALAVPSPPWPGNPLDPPLRPLDPPRSWRIRESGKLTYLAGPTLREWGNQPTNVKVEGPSFPTGRASQLFHLGKKSLVKYHSSPKSRFFLLHWKNGLTPKVVICLPILLTNLQRTQPKSPTQSS